ncbi:MAG: CHAD domain-containing protein [Nostocales cyanobacterium]|nr:MAG: CHAD domain-containing protein [Nostocales cyanobacterium]TAF10617.1 MAG: CHAD domain-containing protein [Nostocales cyanobacterium]
MRLSSATKFTTLADYVYQAIEKNLHKTLQWEKSVKKDEDPEALHQMRVGMRRLRTAIGGFNSHLNLPKSVSDKNIGKITKILGNLRDLDVLKEILENNYQPHLLAEEKDDLQIVFSHLAKQRQIALINVHKLFKDDIYKSFKYSLEKWLETPIYQPSAALGINQVLPDLLLPEICKFLLHPAWMFGTEIDDSAVINTTDWTPEELEKNLQQYGENLHDLRKQAKRVRYQMELFTDLYDETFTVHISHVKNIQGMLGQIQDSMVLNQWLTNIFHSKTEEKLSGLNTLLAANRYQLWQQWQPMKLQYLSLENKRSLHLTILQNL